MKTIKRASEQLPAGQPAILFIRIPFAWVGSSLEQGYTNALFEGTRQSSKVSAVVTVVDKPHLRAGTSHGQVTRQYQPFNSPKGDKDVWRFTLTLIEFLQHDLDLLAPSIPF